MFFVLGFPLQGIWSYEKKRARFSGTNKHGYESPEMFAVEPRLCPIACLDV